MASISAAQARAYRLPTTTTPENLEMRFSHMDGKTLNFGNYLLVSGYYFSGMNANSYFGAVYAFADSNHNCESEIRLIRISEDRFPDDGHAIAWAMAQV